MVKTSLVVRCVCVCVRAREGLEPAALRTVLGERAEVNGRPVRRTRLCLLCEKVLCSQPLPSPRHAAAFEPLLPSSSSPARPPKERSNELIRSLRVVRFANVRIRM
ncbi:hypothetical protein F2P81_015038 [Scophthalmus maximus]|uniref:Uncharacterized protein n=1 Tax=Scophthalmus maximus TaxID=52904 RepID=A0A6A4SKR3_SCOMX|nr:hypothetical protein F2P81_015038 [Scophthalmus maximus]